VAFGSDVIPDLVTGLREWRQSRPVPPKFEPIQSGLGCVYLLGDMEVAKELAKLSAVVVAVGKRSVSLPGTRWLAANGPGSHTRLLPGLETLGAPGYSPWYGDGELGALDSVRTVGWHYEGSPLTHAKVLVLGHHQWIELDEGTSEGWVGERAWIGSANWTKAAREHAEIGLWVRDRALVWALATWVTHMLALSERHTSTAVLPAPDLVEADIPEPDWDLYGGYDLEPEDDEA
jgi:hypothetical protein